MPLSQNLGGSQSIVYLRCDNAARPAPGNAPIPGGGARESGRARSMRKHGSTTTTLTFLFRGSWQPQEKVRAIQAAEQSCQVRSARVRRDSLFVELGIGDVDHASWFEYINAAAREILNNIAEELNPQPGEATGDVRP